MGTHLFGSPCMSLFNGTVKRRIQEMSGDIAEQVIAGIVQFSLFP